MHYSPAGGVGKISSRFGTFVHSTFIFDPEAFGLSGEGFLLLPNAAFALTHVPTLKNAGKALCVQA